MKQFRQRHPALKHIQELISRHSERRMMRARAHTAPVLIGRDDVTTYDESPLIVQLRLEGYANQEIADCLDIGLRSVERKLARVREVLAETEG